jgi:hypothetical protein
VLIEGQQQYISLTQTRLEKEKIEMVTKKLVTVFYAHAAQDQGIDLQSARIAQALADKFRGNSGLRGAVLRIVSGRDDHGAHFKGDWDAWTANVVNRKNSVTGKPVYDLFVSPTHRVGKATAQILRGALRANRPVFIWNGLDAFMRVNTILVLDAEDYQQGWELARGGQG